MGLRGPRTYGGSGEKIRPRYRAPVGCPARSACARSRRRPLHGGDNLVPPPRFARGILFDRMTLHVALGRASEETIKATLAAYGVSAVSGTRPLCCDAYTVSDMPRAPTSSVSRMQPLPGSIFRRWQLDLVGAITLASSFVARYLFHAFQPDLELEWGATIRAKQGRLHVRCACAPRRVHRARACSASLRIRPRWRVPLRCVGRNYDRPWRAP